MCNVLKMEKMFENLYSLSLSLFDFPTYSKNLKKCSSPRKISETPCGDDLIDDCRVLLLREGGFSIACVIRMYLALHPLILDFKALSW